MKKVILVLLTSLSAAFAASSSSEEEISNGADPWCEGDYGTGDWLGVRTELEDKGLEISGGYTAEVWGNTTGGLKTGAVYTGLLDFGATLDLEKLVGWKGARVSTRWLWLSGRDASEDVVGNFPTISNLAGFNTLRIPTRDEDQVGVGFVYAQMTKGARRTLELEGSRGVGAEMVLEFTYKAILTPWLYIQPDAQFIINPGATQDLRNAFVLGGRVSINF